jgi:hypothetical protein
MSLQKLKFPILVALLITITIVCAIEKEMNWGLPIMILFYGIFMAVLIYKEKNGHPVSK